MPELRTLTFPDHPDLRFDSAHYLPGHPKCGALHGHTYFVRNLRIICDGFVDFGDIKRVVKEFDHKLIIPDEDAVWWTKIPNEQIRANIMMISSIPTVENISLELGKRLEAIPYVKAVLFELYEGPDQGVVYP